MGKNIIVVDDNRLVLKFLEKTLVKEGHTVKLAQDGFEAMDIIDEFTPDIMFIDMFMPKIDGDKVCQIVRNKKGLKDAYLILFTAAAAELEIDHAKIGVNACIAKGSFDTMAENVLKAVEESERPVLKSDPIPVIGLETIYARQLTKELLSRKHHLETILESLSEGIIEIYDNRVIYANSVAVSMIGVPQEDILYSYPPDLFEGRLKDQVKSAFQSKIKKPIEIGRDSTLDLNNRKVTLKIFPVKSETQTYMIMIADVTDQRRLELQLQQAQKMEAIGTLAGGIAHDFNNLLMGIQGNTSLLLLDLDPESPTYEEVQSIERCVESGAKLTKQLLGFARGGKYMVKATSLNEMIERIARMFERTKKEIRIIEKFQEKIWTVEVDQGQIEQVLMNLFLNAWQAMPSGGDIYIETENVTLKKNFTKTHDAKPGRYIRISVSDTGVGMDKEIQQRIFEPFFTTKEMGEGTGMGLASAFGIVKNHDGIINFTSSKGKGTTFNIFLPVTTSKKVETKVEAVVPKAALIKGTGTILLVDDETVIVEVNEKMLNELGYDVMTAHNGTTAIEIFKKQHKKIDLVILDIIMPDLNGGEVYDRLKIIDPNVKVLLSSGYSVNGQAVPILERGCDGFIQKPFNIKQMSVKLKELLT